MTAPWTPEQKAILTHTSQLVSDALDALRRANLAERDITKQSLETMQIDLGTLTVLLINKGIITQDEYDTLRAEIAAEIAVTRALGPARLDDDEEEETS